MRTSFDPQFLTPIESSELQRWMVDAVDWQIETFSIFGKQQRVPRQTAWFGDEGVCYRYTGQDHTASGWPNEISDLHKHVCDVCLTKFNFVILNRYRSGADYMGWHKDAESGALQSIASVSLGASRVFKIVEEQGVQEFDLSDGSLLHFNGHLRHQLPKRAKQNGERFNLTFRTIEP